MRNRLSNKTVVIVSNRIKLLSMTDHTLILEEGRIVADATHDRLVTENAFYKSMYRKQMRKDGGTYV